MAIDWRRNVCTTGLIWVSGRSLDGSLDRRRGKTSARYAPGWSSAPRFRRPSLEGCPAVPHQTSSGFTHTTSSERLVWLPSPPSDFGLWCLKQAVAMADEKPLTLQNTFWSWPSGRIRDETANAGLSLEVLREYTERNETLKAQLDRLLAPSPTTKATAIFRERARLSPRNERSEKSNGSSSSAPTKSRCVRTEQRPPCFTR